MKNNTRIKVINGKGKVKLEEVSRKNGISYRLRYWTGSKWFTKTLELKPIKIKDIDRATKRWAEIERAELEKEIFENSLDGASIFKGKTPFITYFEKIKKDRVWDNCLMHLKEFPKRLTPLHSITDEWAKDIRDFLLNRGLSTNTALLYYTKIKAAKNRAIRENIIRKYIEFPPIKKDSKVIRYLTWDEVALLKNCHSVKYSETRRAFLFACFQGLRISDIRKFAFGNVKLKENKISFIITKTGKPLEMELHEEAKEIIFQGIDPKVIPMPSQLVFPNLKNSSIVDYEIKQLAALAVIKQPVKFHMSRSSFAVELIRRKVPIETISKLLGHSKITITLEHYAEILDSMKSDAIHSLPRIAAN
jgi:integrase